MLRWLARIVEWTPAIAREELRRGKIPARLRVRGTLDLAGCDWLTYLPRELEATRVVVARCRNLRGLPERLTCDELYLQRTNIQCLSAGLKVSRRIDAQNCTRLETVFPLRVEHCNLQGCAALERLPEGFASRWLQLGGCTRIVELPASVAASVEHLDLTNCTSLTTLRDNFTRLHTLDVQGCTNLESLPEGIRIRSSIDVAGSGLRSLPWSLRSVRVLWRGIPVSDRVAFSPELITAEEVLRESNIEVRRILLERVGMEWLLGQTEAIVTDHDSDRGGERRLLRISFPNGEDAVCVEVRCPSTGHRYVLRVPPQMRTCAEAAAWVAGFANPARYRPVMET